jgi:WD40 repeat protein
MAPHPRSSATQFKAPSDRAIYSISLDRSDGALAIGQQSAGHNSPTLSLMDISNGEITDVIERSTRQSESVYRVLFSPRKDLLAYVIQEGSAFRLAIYDRESRSKATIEEEGQPFLQNGLSIASDGRLLVLGAETISLFDTQTMTEVGSIRSTQFETDLDDDPLFAPTASISPDGKLLALGGLKKNRLSIIDIQRQVEIRQLQGPFKATKQIAFDRKGELIAAVDSFARGLCLWDVRSGERVLSDLFNEDGASIYSCCFSPSMNQLAVGYVNSFVSLFDLPNGEELLSDSIHKGRVHQVCFDSEGTKLISGGQDQRVVIRAIRT